MPVVSVLMVTHRVTPYLRPAVASVLGQTLADFELLLVDNGAQLGPDDLGPAATDPRLRLIRLPANLGFPAAVNAAIPEVRSDFVALLDHDDVARPHRLERQVAALREDPTLGLVCSGADTIDANGAVIGRQFLLPDSREQLIFSAYSNPGPAPSYAGRREVFRRFRYREWFTVASDYDFLSRALESVPARGLREVLMQYRWHPAQATQQQHTAQVLKAGVVRLLTARRRSGRDEAFDSTVERAARWGEERLTQAEIYRRMAGWYLGDGFPLLAVFAARRAVRQQPCHLAWAMRVLLVALRRSPGERGLQLHLFLRGPLRAHRLHPA